MTNEEMKKLWDTGDYDCYIKANLPMKAYWGRIPDYPDKEDLDKTYKLIHKKDSEIAKAVAENPDVEIYSIDENKITHNVDSFFNNYDEKLHYYLEDKQCSECEFYEEWQRSDSAECAKCTNKKSTFYEFTYWQQPTDSCAEFASRLKPKQCTGEYNGYYVEASQGAYDLLVELGYKMKKYSKWNINFDFFIVGDGEYTDNKEENTFYKNATVSGGYVHLYYNKDKNEFSKVKPNKTNPIDEPLSPETISITDERKEQFAKFGFEVPGFECKIYDEVEGILFGRVYNDKQNGWKPKRWKLDGGVLGANEPNFFDLTPIKQESKIKFPALMIQINNGLPVVVHNKIVFTNTYNNDNFRKATKQERDSLHVSGEK